MFWNIGECRDFTFILRLVVRLYGPNRLSYSSASLNAKEVWLQEGICLVPTRVRLQFVEPQFDLRVQKEDCSSQSV